jgi:hypothetical protein
MFKQILALPLLVVGILFSMGLLMLAAVSYDSPTSDEPPHILSGYVALKYGHDYIDPEHPLLLKAVASSPLLLQNIKVNLEDPDYTYQKETLHIKKLFDSSRRFMNYSGNNPDQILFSGRLMMILMTVLFGVGVYFLAKKLFGVLAGVLAVLLYATEPNIIAHGSLFNTDIGATGFVLLTILALIYYGEKQSWKRLLILAFPMTLALLSKFSALYFAPIVLIFIMFFNWKQKSRLIKHALIFIIVPLIGISLFYGLITFQDRGWSGFSLNSYIAGAQEVLKSVSTAKRPSYLLGESYRGSKLEYFPILVLTKTQLLTLIGFFFALVLVYLNKLSINPRNLLITLVPTSFFFAQALFSTFNIGVRHIFFIYPILIVFSAAGLITIIRLKSTSLFWKKISVVLICGIMMIVGFRIWSLANTYPHYLSYYNFLLGGSDNGWKVANDSNYDWGQDVLRLGDFILENKINSLAFDNYTGIYAAKDYYKLPVRQLSPSEKNYKGYAALSTSVIAYYQDQPENYSWLVDNYKPIAKAGKSIFIYKID